MTKQSAKPTAVPTSVAPVVILGVDSAQNSGAGILVPDSSNPSGFSVRLRKLVKTQFDREACVDALYRLAESTGLPPLISREGWGVGGFKRPQIILSMGESLGKWTAEFERANAKFPHIAQAPVFAVAPNTWRASVLKNGQAKKVDAQNFVKTTWGLDVGEDEAEALCIALHAATQPATFEVISKWITQQSKILSNLNRNKIEKT
jgi:hypothetical protein